MDETMASASTRHEVVLPPELYDLVSRHLKTKDLLKFSLVSKRIRAAVVSPYVIHRTGTAGQ